MSSTRGDSTRGCGTATGGSARAVRYGSTCGKDSHRDLRQKVPRSYVLTTLRCHYPVSASRSAGVSVDECHIHPQFFSRMPPNPALRCGGDPLRRQRSRPARHRAAAPARARNWPGSPRATTTRSCSTRIPWVGRAQEEHDAFAAALRERGVEVLYLADLLAETLAVAGRPAPSSPSRCSLDPGSATPCAPASPTTSPTWTRPRSPTCSPPGSPTRSCGSAGAAGRAGLRPDGPARLRHRPAAQPAVHPGLVALDRRPGRR